MESEQLRRDVVGVADGAVGAAREDLPLQLALARSAQDALGVRASARVVGVHLREVAERPQVRIVDQVRRETLQLPCVSVGRSRRPASRPGGRRPSSTRTFFGVGDARGAFLRRADAVEVHVGLLDGELPSARRAAGVHHQRLFARVRRRLALDSSEVVEARRRKSNAASPDQTRRMMVHHSSPCA